MLFRYVHIKTGGIHSTYCTPYSIVWVPSRHSGEKDRLIGNGHVQTACIVRPVDNKIVLTRKSKTHDEPDRYTIVVVRYTHAALVVPRDTPLAVGERSLRPVHNRYSDRKTPDRVGNDKIKPTAVQHRRYDVGLIGR